VSVVLVFVSIVAIASAVFFYLRYSAQQYSPVATDKDLLYQDTVPTVTSTIDEDGEIYERGEDSFGVFTRKTKDSLKDYGGMFHEEEIEVAWYPHAEKITESEKNELLATMNPDFAHDFDEFLQSRGEGYESDITKLDDSDKAFFQHYLYELGKVSAPSFLRDKKVYLFTYPYLGMGGDFVDTLVIYDDSSQQFITVLSDSYDWTPDDYLLNVRNYIQGRITMPNLFLSVPDTLSMPKSSATLRFKSYFQNEYVLFAHKGAQYNRGGVADIPAGIVVTGYPDSAIEFRDPTYGPVYFIDNEYRIILADGSVQTYELLPSFLRIGEDAAEKEMYGLTYTAEVVWDADFSESYNTYVIGGELAVSGCGAGIVRQTNIVNNAPWFDENALQQVGTTKAGEGIFVLNNPETRSIYTDFFAYGGDSALMRQHPDLTFEEIELIPEAQRFADFLANDPIIFWKDYKGRWRMYMKSEYQSLAECGKPVIYLYPEETTDVTVEVAPNGGFTYTDPVYPEGGWMVSASPDSQLYSYKEDAVYPYLFWEGHADGFSFSDKGFVFSRDSLEADMRGLLERAGLNERETNDFLDFWLDKMDTKPYVFVTFANQQAFERAAPLRITPQPDSVLRLFMYFEPLDVFKTVAPLSLFGFERRGFSVVEWGGVLDVSSR
jgi:hypothetical protein